MVIDCSEERAFRVLWDFRGTCADGWWWLDACEVKAWSRV